ncbi:hypothetical protein ASPFODRAFT_532433 [Aspergillus luchuensis CBS 106.47]|uniref:Uncharacterized protein n=1 Tax=Aspergillus luchuensis (strain CBS 106.47) TaxID=1137211 RepID=A0A1M3TNJ6_ASPLC|nr:hypothetical protein ASPFODRAFT_532433 [Aspergillus luchuensis CBS 106.47]
MSSVCPLHHHHHHHHDDPVRDASKNLTPTTMVYSLIISRLDPIPKPNPYWVSIYSVRISK